MFSKIKNIFSNIKSFINDLVHGNLLFGQATESGVAANRNKQAGSTLLDNASYQQDDLYGYYNSLGPGALQSLYNKQTEAGLTGQQMALNEMQMDNQRRQYAFQVQGMQEAGLNPALMYQSGAQSAPAAPAPTQGASMSELIQLMLADKQSALLQAQADNTNADTDKIMAETENMKLINKYYPNLTQSQIDKMLSEIGLNDEQIKKIQSEVNLNNLDADLKELDKIIKKAQADESSAFYKATRQLEEAKTERERAEKEKLVVERAMDLIEKEYMEKTNTKMGSASILAIASFLGTILSDSVFSFDSDGFKEKFNKKFNELLDWINKPKKAPWVE